MSGDNRERRDCLTIMMDLLENMSQPTRLTRLLYKSNLNYFQLKRYLAMLINLGLIEEIREPCHLFQISPEGNEFLRLLAAHQRKGKPSMQGWLDF
jgi:predicted transcriptional regulator